jgi:hypothetical protein
MWLVVLTATPVGIVPAPSAIVPTTVVPASAEAHATSIAAAVASAAGRTNLERIRCPPVS